ncbi:MAG: WD40 repeat domain-containing protein [Candidatus Poribacteria bacterium]|nr:WD40 repeat domain-containing protein [Candidatus Poribacteria bacterium]
MVKYLYSNRLFIGILTGVILIGIGGIFYFKHLDNERTLEQERSLRINYQQWHLPDGAKARIGTGEIREMQYSPDGNLLAAMSDIGVWIFNGQTAAPQHLLAAHTGVINSISFSADSSTLAVGTGNGTVQFWDTSTGEHQKTFTRQEYRFGINKVFFMPDSRTVAVVSSRSTMLDLWDIVTGKRKNTPLAASENDPDADIRYIPDMYMNLEGYRNSFSSDGKTIVSYSGNKAFRFWDIATRKEIRTLLVESSGHMMSFSSDLRSLAIASYKKPLHLYDVNSGTQKETIRTDKHDYWFLVFSPDGNFLASYVDGAIRIWDVNTSKEKIKFKENKSDVKTVAFSPDNRTLASISFDHTLRYWDVDTGKVKKTLAGYGRLFKDVSLSADGEMLMTTVYDATTAHDSRYIRLWDSNTGQHEKTFIGHKKGVWKAVLNSDSSKLASYTYFENTIRLWDVSTGKLNELKGPRRNLTGIAFSRDGEVLASWGVAGNHRDIIQHWDVGTGRIQRTLQLNDQDRFRAPKDLYLDKNICAGVVKYLDPHLFVWNLVTGDYNITDIGYRDINVARFSTDGHLLAIVFGQRVIKERNIVLWDVETGKYIRTLKGHTDDVENIAFSTDSQTLASGSQDKTIRLWDIESDSSKVLTDPNWAENFRIYTGVASVLAFSPDGQTLASGMKLGDIHLWDTATGAIKKTFHGHSQRVSHLFFSTDGQTLISASDDGTMLIWNLTHP